MKAYYEKPELEVILFEAEDAISASSDYIGIDFLDLI